MTVAGGAATVIPERNFLCGKPAVGRPHRRQEASVEKDTVSFAIMLSVIDFFLSMVMISGIGLVLSLLPQLNRLGKLDEESMRRGH
jgi:hypothetical protein